ncbi:hypothetical protein QGM71_07410 [Virgibacillus sp. C22-A2]|uniref:Uncharacterized protein n=1 Tax=Virgibacillus tibetensis TaxID=3042313 RepID=A0ABU6KDS0_9BACI|nr:hypothetical protein [Virgibacillus sp. C22-A2]
MTAEVVVMNARGAALAADSAVTIHGKKVYNSADKLFPLTQHHPVGVMVYGSGHFMNVPWETIIKLFGNKLGDQQLDTLGEYADAFLEFLNRNEFVELTSTRNEELFIKDFLHSKLNSIHHRCKSMHRDIYLEYQDEKTIEEIQDIYTQHVEGWLDELVATYHKKELIPPFDETDFNLIGEKYIDTLMEYMKENFASFLITKHLFKYALIITFNSLFKRFDEQYSGVVFVGFGNKELRPATVTLQIERYINGKLKYRKKSKESGQVEVDNLGYIFGLAQSDMVISFMTGIHEKMEDSLLAHLEENLKQIPNTLTENLKDHFKADTSFEGVEEAMHKELIKLYGEFHQKLYHFKQKEFIAPIMDIVGALPTIELAEMAEVLVNMTSFKKKISESLETVGGPIDVAIITKYDGFTWIKHK